MHIWTSHPGTVTLSIHPHLQRPSTPFNHIVSTVYMIFVRFISFTVNHSNTITLEQEQEIGFLCYW